MKRFFLLFAACLSLVVTSAWLIISPASADSSAKCSNGTRLSCTGTDCISADDRPGRRGYCQCSSPNGSIDTKYCPAPDGDGGGGGIEPILP